VSVSVSAPMPDDRSFHVLEAVPSRLEVGASARTVPIDDGVDGSRSRRCQDEPV
jgi:hypothetical protein